jgi:predicted secreted protein
MHRQLLRALQTWGAAMAAAAGLAGPAFAQQPAPWLPPQPANVVSLSATATMELTMDWLTVVFNTQREGTDAAAVQSQLRQALDSALAEARKAAASGAKPGDVLVRTGGFALNPRYAPRGGIAGWQGYAELVIEGRDTTTIAQMMGRIQTLTIGRVGWSLSREAREKVEGEVTAQAIARFRARADDVARQFGMSGYTIREVNVSGSEPGGPPVMMMRAQAARGGADESLPVEAGKAQVTATVSGTVQMK